MEALDSKDVILEFPSEKQRSKTALVLKSPKTRTSIRKIFLPPSVARMMVEWKQRQDELKETLGGEYKDYGLVFTGPFGGPVEGGTISDAFRKLIKENDLPEVVFHSLRHSSITYKLRLNGGDIKAVQGDSGHAKATMVTEQYSHVLSDGQQANAGLIEKYFYEKTPIPEHQGTENAGTPVSDSASTLAMLAKVLADPEAAALLKSILGKM